MRLATIVLDGGLRTAVVRGDRVVPIELPLRIHPTMRGLAEGQVALDDIEAMAASQPDDAGLPIDAARFAPVVPDPGAIYTIGLNYDGPGAAPRPIRPLVYGKAAASVAGHEATLAWDRGVTDDVDAECELGVVIGAGSTVFGYTIINDVSARDARLDGDPWLLGKSLAGFCPVGPWIVTADDFDPADVALGCAIDGEPIQDGRTSAIRFPITEIITYLRRHLDLRPGDLIASGTPVRLTTPPGPGRRLRPGDTVTAWIDGIGELVTHIA